MSEWSVETLKEHYDQRFADTATAVQAALMAAEKAVTKAEIAAERRFELLNELRAGVATSDQLHSLEKIVDELKERIDRTAGQSAGISTGWAAIGSVLLILIAFAGVLIGVLK